MSTQGITVAIGCAIDAEWTALYKKAQAVTNQEPTILEIQDEVLSETTGNHIYHFQILEDLSIIFFKTGKGNDAISGFSYNP